jgi:hypothetical protein
MSQRKRFGATCRSSSLRSRDTTAHSVVQYLEYCDLAASTQRDYERYLEIVRVAWGSVDVAGLLPAHVLALRDKHRTTRAALIPNSNQFELRPDN